MASVCESRIDWNARLRALVMSAAKKTRLSRVALDCGVMPATIVAFVNGGGLTVANAERIARHFGLDLLPAEEE